MIVYDVATKVLDKEQFPQHNAGLIPGITFIVLFQSVEAFTMVGNTHTHTLTHTHTHTLNKITRLEEFITVSILFNGLEPLKPLVKILQKLNSDFYEAYQMIDKVITDIKHLRENIDHEFDRWYKLARKMVVAAGGQES